MVSLTEVDVYKTEDLSALNSGLSCSSQNSSPLWDGSSLNHALGKYWSFQVIWCKSASICKTFPPTAMNMHYQSTYIYVIFSPH